MRFAIPRRLRWLAPVLLAGCVLTGVPAVATAASPCSSAAGQTRTMAVAAMVSDTQCLLNEERAEQGLRALKLDSQLTDAALGHSRDMVAQGYFEHDSLSGRPFRSRIASTGWMDGRRRWFVGENIAWGAGPRAAPRAIMRAWMKSPTHRENILHGDFRVVGIGVTPGTPVAGLSGGTYTTDFGS